MRVYVKRENWSEGIWFNLPAAEEDVNNLIQQLGAFNSSPMIPFVADFDCGMTNLNQQMKNRLEGETLLDNHHLEMWNYLAGKLDHLNQEEKTILEAVLSAEKPDSIEKVLTTLTHTGDYVLRKDIRTWKALGQLVAEYGGMKVPDEIKDYFDYELLGKVYQEVYGMLKSGGGQMKK